MSSIVPIIVLVTAAILLLGYGVYLQVTRRRTILAERLETYASIEEEAARTTDSELQKLGQLPRFLHMVFGPGYMSRLEENLARADIPMRPTEYLLLRGVLVAVGYLIGRYGLGYLHSGIILAVVGFIAPIMFVRVHQNRRRSKFVRQLADALMLLTNSLRSGYGFLKGLELVAKEMSDPISKELNRMLREVNLGTTVDDALLNLGRRVNSQDMDIVIGAEGRWRQSDRNNGKGCRDHPRAVAHSRRCARVDDARQTFGVHRRFDALRGFSDPNLVGA